jgi:hypothetical protein
MAAKSPGGGAPESASFTAKTENMFNVAFSPVVNTCADFQSSAPSPDAPISRPFTQSVNCWTTVNEMVADVAVLPAPEMYISINATLPVVAPDVQIHEADVNPLSDNGSSLLPISLCFVRWAWVT